MAALSIQVPYPVFYDRDGQPLDNGNIYIGEANLDPVTNPLQVYYDEALTITASQPLKTSNGYVYRNGTPAQLYVDAANFSITVNDNKNLLVYNFPDGTGISPNASSIEYDPPFTGARTSGYTVADKLAEYLSVQDFGSPITATVLQAAVDAAADEGKALYLGDENFTINSTIALPNSDIVIHGPGAAALTITFTGTGGLFSGPNLSSTTNIDIGGFTAVAGAPNCGVPVYLQYTTSIGIDIRAANIFDVVIDGDSTNYWTGGLNINNARNSIFSDCYVHGPTDDLSKTQYGILVAGQATDVKIDNCQVVSVGTGVQILENGEGTIISNFVAVDVNIGVSKSHLSGDAEPWLAMSNWHINCRQTGIYLKDVLQTTITNGLLYCQNGVGDFIGVHVDTPAVVNQDIMVDALIDAQLAGGSVTSTTGIKINSGNGVSARLKLRSLDVGADIATGVTNSIVTLEPNAVTSIVTGAGVYEATNRIFTNLPALGYGLPDRSGPFNADNSATVNKSAELYCFGEDTTGLVKAVGGHRAVSQDANWVNTQVELFARRSDAVVEALIVYGNGTPEGVVTAPVGALFTRSDGGAGTTLYIKESGTGNTGWVAK
jgi:hypothetical protein